MTVTPMTPDPADEVFYAEEAVLRAEQRERIAHLPEGVQEQQPREHSQRPLQVVWHCRHGEMPG